LYRRRQRLFRHGRRLRGLSFDPAWSGLFKIKIQNHVISDRCSAEIALIKIEQGAIKVGARLVVYLGHGALITSWSNWYGLDRCDINFSIDQDRLDFDRIFDLPRLS